MSKLIEDLKAAGWVESTLGECRMGDEVVVWGGDGVKVQSVVKSPKGADGFVQLKTVGSYLHGITVLRAPRPEYEPGTVALIRWREDQPLVRAWKVPGQWILTGGIPLDDDVVEVVRVLLPADQDTPAVEVTDEMVERAAEACCYACNEDYTFRSEWGDVCEKYPDAADLYRRAARATLEAALGVEK